MNLGQCSITRAEMRGAIAGLELAWDFGFRRVELQIDSKIAVRFLSSSETPMHQHVFRESTKAADFLASRGYEFPFGIHLYPLSDCNLGHILIYDCLGISEPRLLLINE
ncbi:Putative ribonuclease H protein At1g65750 [Linum perenne]